PRTTSSGSAWSRACGTPASASRTCGSSWPFCAPTVPRRTGSPSCASTGPPWSSAWRHCAGPWRSSTTRSPTTAGPRPTQGLSSAQRVQQRGRGEELDAHGDGVLVDVEVALVQVTHGALARGAHAEAGHRAGDVLQVPGEVLAAEALFGALDGLQDRKSTRLNSSHVKISYAV